MSSGQNWSRITIRKILYDTDSTIHHNRNVVFEKGRTSLETSEEDQTTLETSEEDEIRLETSVVSRY